MNNKNNKNDFFKKHGASIAICSSIAVLLVATLYFSFNSVNKSLDKEYPELNLTAENETSILESVNQSDVKSYKENPQEKDGSNTEKDKSSSKANTEDKTNKDSKEEKDSLSQNTEDKAADDKSKENTTSQNTNENKDKTSQPEKTTSLNDSTFSLFDDTKEMTWPVSGKIVMDYSMETAIYDKTLEQYRTNDSIAISAEEGSEVLASAEGVVERIYADIEDGNTIVINHGNGWTSTYSQLQDNVLVAVGDIVKEGQTIGSVGSPSSYTAMLGAHLDFKVTKDNISADPKVVLAQIEE